MKASELRRALRKYAKRNDIPYDWQPGMGKGSHGTFWLGNRKSVIGNPKGDLATGTLNTILKQLGVSKDEL